MNKYIIRNCPAFVLMRTATSRTYFNICGIAKGHVECKDCTDCVMKQIVEKCQGEINADWYKSNAYYAMGRVAVAEKILSMLDIEEC